MPIYEYLCHDCSYMFELKQSMKDEAVATCAKCGKSVSRIISAPAIMFKGSGWYITDYSDKMKPPTEETTTPTPAATTTAPADSSATPATASPSTPAAASTPPASGGTTSSSTPPAGSAPVSSTTSGQK